MSVIVYECPNCGGGLKFKSETQKWECEFCGTSHTLEELKNQQEPATSNTEAKEEDFQMKRFVCPQCAGEIITDETTAASFCVYCGNATIFPEQLSGEFKPDYILPFQKSKEDAVEAYQKMIHKKPLLPDTYKEKSTMDKVKGVYVPFWIFDYAVEAELEAAGRNITQWRSGDYEYTKTDHYKISRRARMNFQWVPADGSSKMEDSYMEAIEPFHITEDEKKDFSFAYLSGYLAERHDIEAEAMRDRVKQRLNKSAVSVLQDTITGYHHVNQIQADSTFSENKVRQILLPVWLLTSQYKGKTYRFAMNGQTGKIIGVLPISIKKSVAFFAGISGILCLIWLIIGAVGVFL